MKQTMVGLIVLLMLVLLPFGVEAQTLAPTEEITLAPTLQPTESNLASPTIELSPTAAVTVINDGDQDNLTIWFLGATIGLLLIIIVAQAWPKKDEES